MSIAVQRYELGDLQFVSRLALVPVHVDSVGGVAVVMGEVERRAEASSRLAVLTEEILMPCVVAVDLPRTLPVVPRPDPCDMRLRPLAVDEPHRARLRPELRTELREPTIAVDRICVATRQRS